MVTALLLLTATVLNCTLLPSPEPTNTDDVLMQVIADLAAAGAGVTTTRVVDHTLRSGRFTDLSTQDGWWAIQESLSRSDIVVLATPTWRGRSPWVAQVAVRQLRSLVAKTPSAASRAPARPAVGVLLTSDEAAEGADSELDLRVADLDLALPGLRQWSRAERGAMVADLVAAAKRPPSSVTADRGSPPAGRSPIT